MSAIGGAYFFGKSANRVLSLVSGTMTADSGKGTESNVVWGGAVAHGQGKPADPTPQDNRQSASWSAGIFAGLLASVVALGWIVLRRNKCRRHSELKPLPHSQFAESDLCDRFFDKRQYLLRLLSKDGGLLLRNQMLVRHLMTTEAVVVSPETSCARVHELMRESCVRHLLVCDKNKRLLGVISNRDLCSTATRTAADLMTTRIQTVSADTALSPAITHLVNEGISCLPVVEDGRLCGILTTTDLILALQCTLQLWLHAAQTMHSETWEQEMIERVQSQVYAADADTCYGLHGVFEALLARAESNLQPSAP